MARRRFFFEKKSMGSKTSIGIIVRDEVATEGVFKDTRRDILCGRIETNALIGAKKLAIFTDRKSI